MAWWVWIVIGFGFILGEVFTPTQFFLASFGAGALAVGGLVVLGVGGPPWFQWCLATLLSVLFVVLSRKPMFGSATASSSTVAGDVVGAEVVLDEKLAPNAIGQGTLRGVPWKVRNLGAGELAAGSRCVVEEVDGVTLIVRK